MKRVAFGCNLPEGVPSVLTVLNTMAEAERDTQNNKGNQGLFVATLSFMLSQSSGNSVLLPDDCESMKLRVQYCQAPKNGGPKSDQARISSSTAYQCIPCDSTAHRL